ncbi:MAG: shikimate kinase, partial [Fusobacteriaceae bacterium]
MKEKIALIGFMGSGKTTVGRQLAKALEMKFIDI